MSYQMRSPCPSCGSTDGALLSKNGQDTVRCANCNRHCYNAPRTETGKAQRSVSTVHAAIKPSQRARVLLRDGNACAICHASDRPLHVGHLLAVDTGLKLGLTDSELNSDDNLAAMCEECNLGIGANPLPLRLAAAILKSCVRGLSKGASGV